MDHKQYFESRLNDEARVVVEKVNNGMTVHDALRSTGCAAGWALYAMEPKTVKLNPKLDYEQIVKFMLLRGGRKICTTDIAAGSSYGSIPQRFMFAKQLQDVGYPLFEASVA